MKREKFMHVFLSEPETIDPPELGDSTKVVSEDDEIAAAEKRNEAVSAFAEGDFDKAVDLYTEAIKLNPGIQIYIILTKL